MRIVRASHVFVSRIRIRIRIRIWRPDMQADAATQQQTKRPVSQQARQRMSRARNDRVLTVKQQRFIKEYARRGNATAAAKEAGYKGNDVTLAAVGYENLNKPQVKSALTQEMTRIEREVDYSPMRVRRRLDALSHGAERAEQYGVAVRAEELIGKAAGMFVDQSIQLRGDISADHLTALLEVARARQAQPIDLGTKQNRRD
jgi:hypothetical protein